MPIRLENYHRLKSIYDMVLKSLENFTPLNMELWNQFFGNYSTFSENLTTYIIVGSPNPYDAMVREDEEGKKCTFFIFS